MEYMTELDARRFIHNNYFKGCKYMVCNTCVNIELSDNHNWICKEHFIRIPDEDMTTAGCKKWA